MKCFTVDGTGIDQLVLTERPDNPVLGNNEVLVDTQAVALNYRDLMVADGRYGGIQSPPIIAASDMAGTVNSVGDKVEQLKAGDRVFNAPFRNWPSGKLQSHWARTFVGGNGVDGVLSEKVVFPAESLVPIPDHMNFQQASTLTIAGLTAWSALITHGKAKAGDWVLLHGTGGVSIFAAQLVQRIGARAILTTSDIKQGPNRERKIWYSGDIRLS